MFLSVLAASVIALALVAQASSFGDGFTAFALVLLPVVLFLGLTTFVRLVAANHDEARWVLGMNRIRAAYLELAPELERWFITSHHDDEKGVMVTGGWSTFPTLFGPLGGDARRACRHRVEPGPHRVLQMGLPQLEGPLPACQSHPREPPLKLRRPGS
jgi:hypothetical protein